MFDNNESRLALLNAFLSQLNIVNIIGYNLNINVKNDRLRFANT